MIVPSGWYVVLEAQELKAGRALGVKRFGRDLVFWREAGGKAVAMADLCPHRSAKLSLGPVQNGCLACPFHGFEFEASGACRLVPETEKAAANLQVETFNCREEHGFIWLYWEREPENHIADDAKKLAEKQLPWFEALDEKNFGPHCIARSVSDWPIHISRCIENQLDYAHLPYVHRTTIGRGVDIRGQRNFELSENSIKLGFSEKNTEKGYFHFLFPNIWTLCILPGRFHQMLAFVPVSETETRIYLRAYQKFINLPVLSPLLHVLLASQNMKILGQDKAVVLSQRPNSSIEAEQEKLYPSDRGIVWFRKMWLEKIAAAAEKQPH